MISIRKNRSETMETTSTVRKGNEAAGKILLAG